MISLRTIKNNLLKYFNDKELVIYKYFDEYDNLKKVEIFKVKGYDSELVTFKNKYIHEWERYVNMNKYKEGIDDGIWVSIHEGYDLSDMVEISRQFYTK